MEISNLKDVSIEVLKSMPAKSSLDEIKYNIELSAKILEGLEDKENGNVISSKELLQEIKNWK